MTLPEELVRLSLIDLDDDEPVNRDATMFSAALVDRVWHHAVESAWYAYLKIGGVHTGDRLLEALSVRDRALRVRRLSMLDESEVFPLRWGDLTRDLLELCVGAVSLRVGNNFMLVPPESTLCQLTSLRIDEVLPCDTMLGYFAALPRLSDCSIGAYRMAMSDTQDDSPMRLVSLSVKLADYEDMQDTAASIVGKLASRSSATLRRLTVDCATLSSVDSCLRAARADHKATLPALERFEIGLFTTPQESFEATLRALPHSLRFLKLRYMLAPPSLDTLARDLPVLRQTCPILDRLDLAPHCCGKPIDGEWEAARHGLEAACRSLAIRLGVRGPSAG